MDITLDTPISASVASAGALLTVVAPTFNERDNVRPLFERLERTLAGIDWRLVFVDDDSPDGTAAEVLALARADGRVTCLRRIGRRGLAGAVLEGVMASASPYVAVIDADLQHDETRLPVMLAAARDGADLVVGSRYLGESGAPEGLSVVRRAGSRLAAWLGRRVLKAALTDPVSGFFLCRRTVIDRVAPKLSREGFKILFDIVASQPAPLHIVELPYAFAPRQSGASKLDRRIVVEYLGLLLARMSGNLLPPRALMFAMVGAAGLVVHLAALRALLSLGLGFGVAQGIAAVTAMTSNFFVNNAVTYRDRRLAGRALILGYLRFCGLCGVGLVANVAVADLVHRLAAPWWLAGAAGAAFGAVWNYVTTSLAVW